MPTDPSLPGEHFEARQTAKSEDYTPDPKKSLPLSPARQALVDDIIALYGCEPTVKRVERYTPDCVYDDQFVYANDRYKMAGQWFALPKLFNASKNEGYQVVVNEKGLIQFKNAQVRFLPSLPPPQFPPPAATSTNSTRSPGPSASSPKPPPSTPSSPSPSTRPPKTPTSSASSTTKTKPTTKTTAMKD